MGEYQAAEDNAHGPVTSIKTSMEDLNGCWALEKSLSTDLDTILKLQKINWVLRRAINSAPIYLQISHYTGIDPETTMNIVHVDIVQKTSISMVTIEDRRKLNWQPQEHEDYIFGRVMTRSRLIRGSKGADGIVRPNIELSLSIGDEKVLKFLRGEIDANGSECSGWLVESPQSDEYGEGSGLWMHTFECSEKSTWAAETIWGFEIVDGERLFTSRVVATDSKGNYKLGRAVFQYQQ